MKKYNFLGLTVVTWGLIVAIVGVVASVAAIVVSVTLHYSTFNSRYDSNATASGKQHSITFNSKSFDYSTISITPTAGSVYGGAHHSDNEYNTNYEIYYKKASNSEYIYLSDNSSMHGNYYLSYYKYSMKYDVKIEKQSNLSNETIFNFDWAVK